jgi:hypothetical protein
MGAAETETVVTAATLGLLSGQRGAQRRPTTDARWELGPLASKASPGRGRQERGARRALTADARIGDLDAHILRPHGPAIKGKGAQHAALVLRGVGQQRAGVGLIGPGRPLQTGRWPAAEGRSELRVGA